MKKLIISLFIAIMSITTINSAYASTTYGTGNPRGNLDRNAGA